MDVPFLLTLRGKWCNVGIIDAFLSQITRIVTKTRQLVFRSTPTRWWVADGAVHPRMETACVLDATEPKESRGTLLHMETYDIMAGQVDEGAVSLAVNLAVAFLGIQLILLRRSCHAAYGANVFVKRQRRENCEDFVADPLQTITAMDGSKWSVPKHCAAGYR